MLLNQSPACRSEATRRLLPSFLLVLLALALFVAPARAGNTIDKDLTQQISDILTECKMLTPGNTRAELMKVFTTEGGLSTARHRTFVHRHCPYIKVDVDFTPSDPKQATLEEKPTDTISKISKPYLEWSVID